MKSKKAQHEELGGGTETDAEKAREDDLQGGCRSGSKGLESLSGWVSEFICPCGEELRISVVGLPLLMRTDSQLATQVSEVYTVWGMLPLKNEKMNSWCRHPYHTWPGQMWFHKAWPIAWATSPCSQGSLFYTTSNVIFGVAKSGCILVNWGQRECESWFKEKQE